MNICSSDGNQGFPVVLDGSINSTEDIAYKSIQSEPEIYSAFGRSTTFPQRLNQNKNETQSDRRNIIAHPNAQSNTLNYKGGLYSLIHIQVCQKTQSGSWPTAPRGTNSADCVFTYNGTSSISTGMPNAIILIVPLYEEESLGYKYGYSNKEKPLMYFTDILMPINERPAKPRVESLGEVFSGLGDSGYALYSSCILLRMSQTKVQTKNILGLYFPFGWILPTDIIKQLGDFTYQDSNRYAPLYLPSDIRDMGAPVAKVQPNGKTAPAINAYIANADTWSTNGQTYPQIISANSVDFTKRLLFVKRGLLGLDKINEFQKLPKTTFEYQCLPLDKAKDINGTYVLLDPATGKRSLYDTLQGTDEQKKDLEMTTKVDSSNAIEKFAITAGIVVAIILVLLVFSFVVKYIMAKNRQGLRADNLAEFESIPKS
jgi:hypothetical protein